MTNLVCTSCSVKMVAKMAWSTIWKITAILLMAEVSFSNALRCLKCNSTVTPSCAQLVGTNPEANCPDDDFCVTMLANTATIRGCSSDMSLEGIHEKCDAELCNDKIYPGDRLKCFQCLRSTCHLEQTDRLVPCLNYKKDDECYTYVEEFDDTFRGCMSDDENNIAKLRCVGNPDECVRCNDSGCNKEAAEIAPKLSCFTCDSTTDLDCETATNNTNKCTSKVLFGHTEKCFSLRDGDKVKRGCIADDQEAANFCGRNKDKCQQCSGDNCNDLSMVEQSCIVCDSRDNSQCKANTVDLASTVCANAKQDGCFLLKDGNDVRRGCVAALNATDLLKCEAGNDCKICKGVDCNRKVDFQSCFSCRSSTNTPCAQLSTTDLPKKICDEYLDTCKVNVDAVSGETFRGCFNETFIANCDDKTAYCRPCEANNCNIFLFPENRLKCHQCVGTSGCQEDQTGNTKTTFVCAKFRYDAECFSVIDGDKSMHRGCLLDSSPGAEYCQANPSSCIKCGESNCNKDSAYADPKLSCVQCDPTDKGCAWGHKSTVSKMCANKVELGKNETCFTYTDTSKMVTRGCGNDKETFCPTVTAEGCSVCNNGGCNNQNVIRQVCVKCSSAKDEEKSCAETAEGIVAEECSNDIVPFSERGCYTKKTGSTVIRGCVIDMDESEMKSCMDGTDKSCNYCMENNCNNRMPNNSDRIKGISYFTLFMIAVTIQLNRYI